jgi:putative transposase
MKMNSKPSSSNAIHHRRSIRLPNFDYSQAGAYFVTICTKNRKCLFGEILNREMKLNDDGIFVSSCWVDIPKHFPHAKLDAYVIMPNHIHGIIVLDDNAVGANNYSPLPHRPKGTAKTIGSIIRGFKIGATKGLQQKLPDIKLWQRNYFEHVIRNDNDLNQIRQYVIDNPLNWAKDENYVCRSREKI